jgi:hypothetical protein
MIEPMSTNLNDRVPGLRVDDSIEKTNLDAPGACGNDREGGSKEQVQR